MLSSSYVHIIIGCKIIYLGYLGAVISLLMKVSMQLISLEDLPNRFQFAARRQVNVSPGA
ncbi:hypothetical protein EAE89_10045 [Photorhabdus heterorhabditis]|nr:hypothetical protein [Photorhabdus heterorhabditis]